MTTLSCLLTFSTAILIMTLQNDAHYFWEDVEVKDGPYNFSVQFIAEAQIDLLYPKGFRFLLFNATGWVENITFIGAVNKKVRRGRKSDIVADLMKDAVTIPGCYNYEYVNRDVLLNESDYLQFYLNCSTERRNGFVYYTPVQTLTVGGTVLPTGYYSHILTLTTKKPKKNAAKKKKQ